MAKFMVMILVLLILSPNATIGGLALKHLKIVVTAAKPSRSVVPPSHSSSCTYIPGNPTGPPCRNTPPQGMLYAHMLISNKKGSWVVSRPVQWMKDIRLI